MQNNVYFHVNSAYAGSKAVIVVNNRKYELARNADPLVFTFPVGQTVPVKIKGIKSFLVGTGANKTYTRQIFVPTEQSIIDIFTTIGKGVVQIDIKERNPMQAMQQQMMMQQQMIQQQFMQQQMMQQQFMQQQQMMGQQPPQNNQ